MVSLVKRMIKGHTYYYLVWMKREGKKVVRAKQVYLGTAEKIFGLLSQPLPKFVSYSYGEIALLLRIAEITDFVGITNKHLQKVSSIGDYLLLPVINRLLEPSSKAGITGWYKATCLPLIWNKKLSLSSQNYWYYLDCLTDEKIETIWKELLLCIRDKLKIEDKTFLFDTTNFFTYIDDHENNKLPKKGRSKQKRNDKNQVSVSLTIGEQSMLPYWFEVYAGNIHDSKHFLDVMPEFQEKARIYDKEKITLIFDKGNNSPENFEAIKGYYFIGALVKDKIEAKDLLSAKFEFCYKNSQGNEIRSVSKETEVYGIKSKIVVSYNEELKKKQLHSLDKKITKTWNKFKEIENHKFTTEKAAFNALIEILPKKENPFDYKIREEGEKFRILLNLDMKKVAWYELAAGKNIIFTNHLDWSNEKIIKTYRSMYKLENQFKILHGALLIPLKPVFAWTDQKIKAHIFLCMVALLFAKVLEHICKDKIKGDFRRILDFASTIRLALVYRNGKPKLVFEELEPSQQKLMEMFSLSHFAEF